MPPMVRRVVALALAASCLTAATPAVAQGRAPRSPSDRQVDLRQGTPDLALDSRAAGASPTPLSQTRSTGWSDSATGAVLIVSGSAFLFGSVVFGALAIERAAEEHTDEFAEDDASDEAAFFGTVAALGGGVGLAMVIPGIVLVANDDGAPAATAHVGPTGGSIAVRF